MPAVELDWIPVRRVRCHLGSARSQRIQVLHGEDNVRLLAHPGQAGLEIPRVLPLPAERRMQYDDSRAQLLRRLPGAVQLAPRLAAPYPLRDEQARRMHRQDRDVVVVGEPAQDIHVLADQVGRNHDLDAVVAEPGRGLEGVRRFLREDRGAGQCHQCTRSRCNAAQGVSHSPDSLRPIPACLSLARPTCVIRACQLMPARAARPPIGNPGLSAAATTVPAMGKSAAAALYQCSECGWRSMKWAGRCGECQGWGTVTEARVPALARAGLRSPGRAGQAVLPGSAAAIPITDIDASSAGARPTGLDELDRVLGGGLVPGAVVLLAGEPGVGKSTLLLEAGALAAEAGPVLYVTGEESAAQVRLRADRIGAISKQLYLAAETDLSAVLDHVDAVRPGLLIVDSVQTINVAGIDGTPGGVTQIREVTAALMEVAKRQMLTTVLVGHVTKDGSIAGPRALEHLVDVVLHFDGDRHSQLRMVRALKNRFGPTDEIGCFELGEYGLIGLADPSGLFLSQVREPVPGTCVTVALEGRRPLVAEVQTLVCASTLDMARRVTSGLDASRVGMVLAVLQRRAGVTIGKQDVYAATVGGVRLTEPSVGLAGEIRRVPGMQRRLAEAERMGFRTAIVPPGSGGLPDGRGAAAAGPDGPGTASGLPGTADGAGPGRPGSGQLTDVREARDIREAIAAALGR